MKGSGETGGSGAEGARAKNFQAKVPNLDETPESHDDDTEEAIGGAAGPAENLSGEKNGAHCGGSASFFAISEP